MPSIVTGLLFIGLIAVLCVNYGLGTTPNRGPPKRSPPDDQPKIKKEESDDEDRPLAKRRPRRQSTMNSPNYAAPAQKFQRSQSRNEFPKFGGRKRASSSATPRPDSQTPATLASRSPTFGRASTPLMKFEREGWTISDTLSPKRILSRAVTPRGPLTFGRQDSPLWSITDELTPRNSVMSRAATPMGHLAQPSAAGRTSSKSVRNSQIYRRSHSVASSHTLGRSVPPYIVKKEEDIDEPMRGSFSPVSSATLKDEPFSPGRTTATLDSPPPATAVGRPGKKLADLHGRWRNVVTGEIVVLQMNAGNVSLYIDNLRIFNAPSNGQFLLYDVPRGNPLGNCLSETIYAAYFNVTKNPEYTLRLVSSLGQYKFNRIGDRLYVSWRHDEDRKNGEYEPCDGPMLSTPPINEIWPHRTTAFTTAFWERAHEVWAILQHHSSLVPSSGVPLQQSSMFDGAWMLNEDVIRIHVTPAKKINLAIHELFIYNAPLNQEFNISHYNGTRIEIFKALITTNTTALTLQIPGRNGKTIRYELTPIINLSDQRVLHYLESEDFMHNIREEYYSAYGPSEMDRLTSIYPEQAVAFTMDHSFQYFMMSNDKSTLRKMFDKCGFDTRGLIEENSEQV